MYQLMSAKLASFKKELVNRVSTTHCNTVFLVKLNEKMKTLSLQWSHSSYSLSWGLCAWLACIVSQLTVAQHAGGQQRNVLQYHEYCSKINICLNTSLKLSCGSGNRKDAVNPFLHYVFNIFAPYDFSWEKFFPGLFWMLITLTEVTSSQERYLQQVLYCLLKSK